MQPEMESIAAEAQRSGVATKTLVVRNGFAACCEEWLCLSVELALSPGLRPCPPKSTE
jgi:hypothetical protein